MAAERSAGRWSSRGTARLVLVLAGAAALGALMHGVVLSAGLVPWQLVIAGLLVVWTAVALARSTRRVRRARRAERELAGALRAVIRELRAGASPAEAAVRAEADAGPGARRVLAACVGRAGAPEPGGGRRAGPAVAKDVVDQLSTAWNVSVQRGVPLAEVLTACVADLDDRAAAAQLRAQQVAGPAMSAYVLAALPVAGIAMGAGMGSHPGDVLLGSHVGGVLLVAGVALVCAGLAWSNRIVGGGRG